jgi:LuxR family maltose regulon positive regulatory protein
MGDADFEISQGVTLSRTLIPMLPPNYLSRKHLFPLLESEGSSTTVLIAPAGYGKSSLVAEWAGTRKEKVIWLTLTQRDSLADMSALFMQATRNVIPGFGDWFTNGSSMRPVEIVRRWGNDLMALKEEIIFVIDNFREHTSKDVDIASRLVEQFPANLKFITIRRDSIENVYSTFSSRGPLKVVGKSDLAFSGQEIAALANMYKVDLTRKEISESISAAQGWPSAVSMLLYQISKNKKPIDFEKIAASEAEPIRTLAKSVIESAPADLRNIVTALSVVQEFSYEQAEVILEKNYSYDLINQIAIDGNFFTQTGIPEQTFEFSKLMREVLLAELRKQSEKKIKIHARLLEFHENRNESHLAIEHAFLSDNSEKVRELFPDAARVLQATGKSQSLIRWSIFAGDTSREGLLKRATVELAGLLAASDFQSALNAIDQMRFEAKGTVLEGFISQITYGAQAYVDFTLGNFEDLDDHLQLALHPTSGPLALGIEEQIALLRLAAMRFFILDETEKVEEILERARKIANSSRISQNHLMLSSIQAMQLFQIGDYRRAYEAASISYAQFQKRQYVGIFGPLDSLFVMARCLLEFARPTEAKEKFLQVRNMAEQWNQWAWYFMADGFISRALAFRGLISESLESIKSAHQLASELPLAHNLDGLIDLSEIFIRYQVKDYERLEILLQRAPQARFTQQIKLSLDEKMGKKSVRDAVRKLPARTPREKIWKHLADASEVIDQENLAMQELKKALEVGALVGAKETFLRQSHTMGNLILKIAGTQHTVYLEDLATAVANRMKENQNNPNDLTSSLTKREIEVLRHLSTERPISVIAASLHISINTMKTHLKNLYRKMNVENRAQAVEKAKSNFIL